MQYVTENITPAKALEYINTNKDNNRPISKSVVHSYADTMKKGKWLLNGECIIFEPLVAHAPCHTDVPGTRVRKAIVKVLY